MVGRVGNCYVQQGGQTENQVGKQKKIIKQMFANPGLKPCQRPCVVHHFIGTHVDQC